MSRKKRNKMEDAQSLNGAAQELDMDALENVAGGVTYNAASGEMVPELHQVVTSYSTGSAAQKLPHPTNSD